MAAITRLFALAVLTVFPALAQIDPGQLEVVDTQKIVLEGEGRSIIFNRTVTPPLLPRLEPETPNSPAPPPPLTPEQQQRLAEWQAKEKLTLTISATVYDREITQLRWQHQGVRYVAWSRADFSVLQTLTALETESTRYSFFIAAGHVDTTTFTPEQQTQLPQSSPNLPPSNPQGTAFVLSEPASDPRQEAQQMLADLHSYYDAHKAQLITAYETAEARRLEREQQRQQETAQDTVIHYFPISSSFQENQ